MVNVPLRKSVKPRGDDNLVAKNTTGIHQSHIAVTPMTIAEGFMAAWTYERHNTALWLFKGRS